MEGTRIGPFTITSREVTSFSLREYDPHYLELTEVEKGEIGEQPVKLNFEDDEVVISSDSIYFESPVNQMITRIEERQIEFSPFAAGHQGLLLDSSRTFVQKEIDSAEKAFTSNYHVLKITRAMRPELTAQIGRHQLRIPF